MLTLTQQSRPHRLLYLLPIAPAFAFSFISNFPDMYKPNRPYILFPATLMLLAALIAYAREYRPAEAHRLRWLPLATLFALALFFGEHKPIKAVATALREPASLMQTEGLEALPHESTVVVTEAAAMMLLDRRELYLIDKMAENADQAFDYIVVHPSEQHRISERLAGMTKPCFANENWHIRCRTESL